jgi:ribulose-phosphate 3-epimerase
MIKVTPSILSSNFAHLARELRRCEEAGVDGFHLDIMDGHFVPNISFGPVVVKAVRRSTALPLEAHLMIEHPWLYIEDFVKAGADIVTLHVENYGPLRAPKGEFPREVDSVDASLLRRDLEAVRRLGARAALTLNPGTPLRFLEVLDAVDMVLVMSVNPGFSGQAFKPEVLEKIEALRAVYGGDIEVDGGISDVTAPAAVKAGANILVTASWFFSSGDLAGAVKKLKSR